MPPRCAVACDSSVLCGRPGSSRAAGPPGEREESRPAGSAFTPTRFGTASSAPAVSIRTLAGGETCAAAAAVLRPSVEVLSRSPWDGCITAGALVALSSASEKLAALGGLAAHASASGRRGSITRLGVPTRNDDTVNLRRPDPLAGEG